MKLYSYWRSSCSWRVRIALAYKGLEWTGIPVHLTADGGAQFSAEHRTRNPLCQVPVLCTDDGLVLSQSMAILEYLEERFPEPSLLWGDAEDRARIRQYAQVINAQVQPLQNLAVLRKLESANVPAKAWARDNIQSGLDALERMVQGTPGPYLAGEQLSVADVCLLPQLYNARRFQCDLSAWPTLLAAEDHAWVHPAFSETRPENQPDAVAA